jgi:hypothetical protein
VAKSCSLVSFVQNNLGKESALFTSQFKGKCRNCGKLCHKAAQCKSKQVQGEKCNYCKKSGHVKANCFKLLRRNSGMNISSGMAYVVLSSMTKIEDFGNDIWIGDSGASCHYCNNDAALYDYPMISEDITVGNGNVMTATNMGSYDVRFCRKMVRAWLSRLKT